MKKESEHLHVQEIVELCQSFRENRTHHRDHMRQLLDSHLKPVILSKWADEVEYNQRVLFNLMQEMDHLEYYDEQIWQHCFQTVSNKKRINNLTFFSYFNEVIRRLNTDPKSPFFKKLDEHLKKLKTHYTADRKWRYDFEGGHMYSLDEMIAKRDTAKQDDFMTSKGGEDKTLIQKAMEAEKKMKRLRMAKYSVDLFDEIVTEMMKEKRTLMEMMAELDVDDEKILESQQRITNRRLKAGLSISMD